MPWSISWCRTSRRSGGEVVLVIDDLDELRAREALELLESFLARVPPTVRVVLATREEPRLGQHRLRVAGVVTELRADDLRLTAAETRELLEASGVTLSDEGWRASATGPRAGLRVCGWRRSRLRGTRTRSGLCASSPAATRPWRVG
jgi:hypothetical protein